MKIAFDIGGTSTRIATISAEGLGDVKKIPTPKDPKDGLAQIVALARELAHNSGIEAAAGGFPGVVKDGVLSGIPNLPAWEGFALANGLSEALGGVEVIINNDADMAALGEATFGAGKGARIVAYLGVGTGVGGGRIVEGKIDAGTAGLEPGHQILDMREMQELEHLISGRAFENKYGTHPKDAPRAAYEEMTPVLALGMFNTILHWSPDVFVLGGSMVFGINSYGVKAVATALKKIPGNLPFMPEIKMAELKDAAGLHGARAILMKK